MLPVFRGLLIEINLIRCGIKRQDLKFAGILCQTRNTLGEREYFMAKKQRILAFAGSLREHAFTKRVVKTAMNGALRAGAEVDFIDLRDYPMPIYDGDLHEGDGFHETALQFQRLLSGYNGFLIASPEYNASLPGALKNAIDWASRQNDEFKMGEVFKGKVAAIMTASPGGFGGIRCLAHLRSILSVLGVNVLPSEIAVGKVHEMFDGDHDLMTNEPMRRLLENLGATLVDTLQKLHGEIDLVTCTRR
jgi:NAD(P)H-dependent FMN reductase